MPAAWCPAVIRTMFGLDPSVRISGAEHGEQPPAAHHAQAPRGDRTLPGAGDPRAFGYDLATVVEERIAPRETRVVPCGFQLGHDLPHDDTGGLAMLVLPRSSLPLRYGLILPNSPGLIDADYSKPLGIIVHNLTKEPIVLPPDTRIAQAVFVHVAFPQVDEVFEADESRTRGGFGSTGT